MVFSRFLQFSLLASSAASLIHNSTQTNTSNDEPIMSSNNSMASSSGIFSNTTSRSVHVLYRTITVGPTVTVTESPTDCALTLDNPFVPATTNLAPLFAQSTTPMIANGPVLPLPDSTTTTLAPVASASQQIRLTLPPTVSNLDLAHSESTSLPNIAWSIITPVANGPILPILDSAASILLSNPVTQIVSLAQLTPSQTDATLSFVASVSAPVQSEPISSSTVAQSTIAPVANGPALSLSDVAVASRIESAGKSASPIQSTLSDAVSGLAASQLGLAIVQSIQPATATAADNGLPFAFPDITASILSLGSASQPTSMIQLMPSAPASALVAAKSGLAIPSDIAQTTAAVPEVNGPPLSIQDSTRSSPVPNVASQPMPPAQPTLSATASAKSSATIPSSIEGAPGDVYEVQGCFPDVLGIGLPVMELFSTGVGSSKQCVSACFKNNYKVAGIEGTTCYCSNSMDQSATSVDLSNCMIPCSDDTSLACGEAFSGARKRAGGLNLVYMMLPKPTLTSDPVSVPRPTILTSITSDINGLSGTPSSTPIIPDIAGLLNPSLGELEPSLPSVSFSQLIPTNILAIPTSTLVQLPALESLIPIDLIPTILPFINGLAGGISSNQLSDISSVSETQLPQSVAATPTAATTLSPQMVDISGPLQAKATTTALPGSASILDSSPQVTSLITLSVIPLPETSTRSSATNTVSPPAIASKGHLNGPLILAPYPLNSTQLNTTSANSVTSSQITFTSGNLSTTTRGRINGPPTPTLSPTLTFSSESNTSLPIFNTTLTGPLITSSGRGIVNGPLITATVTNGNISTTQLSSITNTEGKISTALIQNGPLQTATPQKNLTSTGLSSTGLNSTAQIPFTSTNATSVLSSTSSSLVIIDEPFAISPTLAATINSTSRSSSVASSTNSTALTSIRTTAQSNKINISTTASATGNSKSYSTSHSSPIGGKVNGPALSLAPTNTAATPNLTSPISSTSTKRTDISFSSFTSASVIPSTSSRANGPALAVAPSNTSSATFTSASATANYLGSTQNIISTSTSASLLSITSASVISPTGGIANGPALPLSPTPALPSTFLTMTIPSSPSPTCTPPTISNGGFEDGTLEPWLELLDSNVTSAATVYKNSKNSGITSFGDYYLNTTLTPSHTQTFYQNVTTCPHTTYTITGYAQVAPLPLRHIYPSTQPCGFQICEGVSGKCSEEMVLQDEGFSALGLTFRARGRAAQVQIVVNCAGNAGSVNRVYLDQVTIG